MSHQHQYTDGAPIHFPLDKLVCVGRNYTEHTKELDNPVPAEPLLFIKPGSRVVPVNGGLSLPQKHSSVYYETRITMLIGKPLSCKPNCEEVLGAIPGYALTLDLALRKVQAKLREGGLPWELARSFDGTGVLSSFVNADQFSDPTDIGIRLAINGEVRQDGDNRDMLSPTVPLIQHIVGHLSPQAGDVVPTGMPSRVGPLSSGDELLLELPDTSRSETRVL